MTLVHRISADLDAGPEVLGAKAHGLVVLERLGLPVPPAVVLTTEVWRTRPADGGLTPAVRAELATAVSGLEAATGRRLGGTDRPLLLSVRSGAAVSMPGMMDTLLDVGLTRATTAALAAETGDRRLALDCRLRLVAGWARTVAGVPAHAVAEEVARAGSGAAGSGGPDEEARLAAAAAAVDALVRARTGVPVPDDPAEQLARAVEAVLASWDAPRARTYRALHGVPDDLGTAVVVQAMVLGNRDGRSGSGVAASRDPGTGAPGPAGEVLLARQGDDVVSGRAATRPLAELAVAAPRAWAELLDALRRLEAHHRDACSVELTVESDRLWLLQARHGGTTGLAAVRVAVDLADEGVLDRAEALLRVPPDALARLGTARIDVGDGSALLARGLGACPGVAVGRVALTADAAVRMAADGPVLLVRPETTPGDLHGFAAAAGVLTARGGPASHAAVVARSMGRPAVVGAAALDVDPAAGVLRAGGRTVAEGDVVAVDGTGGEAVVGTPRVLTGAVDPWVVRLLAWADEATGTAARPDAEDAPARLAGAQAALRAGGTPTARG